MMTREDRVVYAATSAHMLTHAYMMIFPAVLILIAKDPFLGIDEYLKLGAIGTLCYGLFGIGAIPSGILADRYGSKRMLTICIFASALSSLGAGLSFSVYPLVLSMVCLGLAASMYHPSGLSFISKNVDKKGRAMGYHGVGGNIGLALGPILSGGVAVFWGWRSAFIVFAILGLILAVVIFRLDVTDEIIPQKQRNEAGGQGRLSTMMILFMIYSTSILYGLCYRGTMMYFPKHFVHNIDFALNDVARAGFLVAMVSLMFAPFFFAWQPIQNTLIARYCAKGAHGLSYGVNFLLIMGVGSLAASVGGYVTDVAGVSHVFAVLGLISALSVVFVFYILGQLRRLSPAQ
jgi:MFS family permease